MKTLKRIVIAIFVIIAFLFMTCEPTDPYYENDNIPYMSDLSVHEIPQKVYAKGKPKRVKKKTLKGYEKLGKFTLTAYCNCSICCGQYAGMGITASGKKLKAGTTVAVDPKKIPYGTKLIINNHEYEAQDCGGGIKGNHIDIYFATHKECLKFGKQEAEVYKRVKKVAKIKIPKLKCKGVRLLADNTEH